MDYILVVTKEPIAVRGRMTRAIVGYGSASREYVSLRTYASVQDIFTPEELKKPVAGKVEPYLDNLLKSSVLEPLELSDKLIYKLFDFRLGKEPIRESTRLSAQKPTIEELIQKIRESRKYLAPKHSFAEIPTSDAYNPADDVDIL